MSAWNAIGSGVTPGVLRNQARYWPHWAKYAATCGIDPFLQTTPALERDIVVTAFAARVRTGVYGKGAQIRVQGVTDALSAIGTTI